MKKVFFAAIAIVAAGLASCGGNKTEQSSALEDSVVEFVQSELKAEMILELDSLLDEVSQCKAPAFVKSGDSGISLTDEEKKVKPDYLLDPKSATNATLLSEKYRALTALRIDRNVASLYGMDVAGYDEAISTLLADINDPALKASMENTDEADIKTLYAAEKEAGRINFVWQCLATSTVESLFITAQNVDKFTSTLDDEAAANITKRLAHVSVSANALVDFDSDFKPVAESINLLKDVNATNAADFRVQLKDQKEAIENARNMLVKYFFSKSDPKI